MILFVLKCDNGYSFVSIRYYWSLQIELEAFILNTKVKLKLNAAVTLGPAIFGWPTELEYGEDKDVQNFQTYQHKIWNIRTFSDRPNYDKYNKSDNHTNPWQWYSAHQWSSFLPALASCRTRTGIIWKEHANNIIKKISERCEGFYLRGLVAVGSACVTENYWLMAIFNCWVQDAANSARVNHTKLFDCT